jgi:hypothetical protein
VVREKNNGSTIVKIAAFAPTASASVSVTETANPGRRRIPRSCICHILARNVEKVGASQASVSATIDLDYLGARSRHIAILLLGNAPSIVDCGAAGDEIGDTAL